MEFTNVEIISIQYSLELNIKETCNRLKQYSQICDKYTKERLHDDITLYLKINNSNKLNNKNYYPFPFNQLNITQIQYNDLIK